MQSVVYDNPRKDNWRRWQWNLIEESLKSNGIKRRDAKVLFLCGQGDDRRVAIERGFSDSNLCGIDLNNILVKKYRKSGGVGVSDDILDFLFSSDYRFWDAVIFDYCCGFEKFVQDAILSLAHVGSIKFQSPIFVNLQRGRDSSTNSLRQCVTNDMPLLKKYFPSIRKATSRYGDKHRGVMAFAAGVPSHILALCKQATGESVSFDKLPLLDKSLSPQFNSYRSSGENSNVRFDSAFWKHFTAVHTEDCWNHSVDGHWYGRDQDREAARRRFIAMKAVQTMKKKPAG